MSDLEIPDRARDLMLRAAWPLADDITRGQRQAARIIVAAELRRLAAALRTRGQELREEDERGIRSFGMSLAVVHLRARADELDERDPDKMTG